MAIRTDQDASKIVCRICGDVSSLPTDSAANAARLSEFTAAHSMHDAFRIDVVTGPVLTARSLALPLQRERGADDRAQTA
jgi:hypothetical protein